MNLNNGLELILVELDSDADLTIIACQDLRPVCQDFVFVNAAEVLNIVVNLGPNFDQVGNPKLGCKSCFGPRFASQL